MSFSVKEETAHRRFRGSARKGAGGDLVYKNARGVLPDALIEEIQKYVDGESIYIPAKTEEKAEWGHRNGTKARYATRNAEIRSLFERNVSVSEISDRYFLSSDTVRKIIRAAAKDNGGGKSS